MSTWTVTSGQRTHTIHIKNEQVCIVDGSEEDVHIEAAGPRRHILTVGCVTYEIILPEGFFADEPAVVIVNGKPVTLQVDDELSLKLRSLEGDSARKVHAATVTAPMPGRISRVLISEGELIEAGQGVCILEAMKMENEIKTPVTGIVKVVRVQEGQAVEKNAVLIDIA